MPLRSLLDFGGHGVLASLALLHVTDHVTVEEWLVAFPKDTWVESLPSHLFLQNSPELLKPTRGLLQPVLRI